MTRPVAQGGSVQSAGSATDEYLAGHARYYAKDYTGAACHLERAVAEGGDNPDAYYLLARAQWRRGDLKSALEAFQNVVRLQPGCAPALTDLAGLLLEELGNASAAEKFSRRALEADPLHAPALVILGNALRARGDDERAASCYREAITINPGLPDPPVNLGVLSLESGNTEEALAWFERGLALDPSHSYGLWNRGNLLLLLGRLREGWPGYEQRFRIRGKNASRPDPGRIRLRWDGSPFRGKTLLVYSEQGLGDTIQFVRYIPMAAELGGNVIFECQDEILPLIGRNFSAGRAGSGQDGPTVSIRGITPLAHTVEGRVRPSRAEEDFDFAVPLLSLPGIFGTEEETIPCRRPYISADAALSAQFKNSFDAGKFNVGIAWAGNPAHPNDGNRSCPGAVFESLSMIPGVQLYSLQKNSPAGRMPGGNIIDLAGSLTDFSATAAILDNLDLLVTVDTAVAHLAGAMGKPVWVLLPHVPDWRWQLVREDSPWYPAMKLFRQSIRGDWPDVMARVRAALGELSRQKLGNPPSAASLFALGSAHFRSGNMDEALRSFRDAVAGDLSNAEYRNALGVVLSATGDKESAAAEIASAIALDPGNAEFRYNLGNLRKEQGNPREAVSCYREALARDPGFLRAYVNLGCVLQEQGNAASALEEYRNALSLDPTSPPLLKQVGMLSQALHDEEGALRAFERLIGAGHLDADLFHRVGSLRQGRGDLEEAIRCYRRAVELNPEHAEAWAQLGTALVLKKLPEEAYRALENALRIKPDFPEVLNNIGMVMKDRGQSDIAEKCFRMALRAKKDYAPAYNNLGTLFLESSRFSDAEVQFREAVRLSPDFYLAWNNLGNALSGLGNFHEAKQIYRSVIAQDPTLPEVHFNLAAALQHEHRFEESIRGYDEALRLRPAYAEARLNRALVLLLRGELAEGWRDYECRFHVKDPRRIYVPPGPEDLRWDGSDIRGKRILVRPEQGFGDTIQFSRYIPLLAERGADVLFECPKELCGLFRGFPGVGTLIEFHAEPPSLPFDRYVQLLSLPGLLGTHAVESIPWPGPYIKADPAVAESVRGRFDDDAFHVGIAWGGNPVHRNDHNRSCSLGEFLPLLDVPGVRFHSLQKGKPASELQSLPGGSRIDNLEPLLTDFSVTAAVLSHLDLVIAVDTSVAHLAGAMGRPVWTLIPYRPDWRWLLDRTDSPWYPGMKLFRQGSHADWPGVISEVRRNLLRLAGH